MPAHHVPFSDGLHSYPLPTSTSDIPKSPLKYIYHVFRKYTVIIGIPKKIYHLAKEIFSLFHLTQKYKFIDFGLKGINAGFILFGAPIHVYNTYANFRKLFKAICKVELFNFFEYSLKLIVDLADIGSDVSSVAVILHTFGFVTKSAIVWAGTLGAISGAFQSLALVTAGIDLYRVHKFQNGFREATKEGKSYDDMLQFLDENKHLTKKVMGMKVDDLIKILNAKESVGDQSDAEHLLKGKVSNKIWIARAALMKAQHKQVIKILSSRANVQMWTTRLALVAGAISVIVAGILILSPFLFPLAAPTIASVGTGVFLSATTLFVGKFFVEKAVDLKFRRDINQNTKNEISPIIIANPITREDVEKIYGEPASKDSQKHILNQALAEEAKPPQIDLNELQKTLRERMLLREVY